MPTIVAGWENGVRVELHYVDTGIGSPVVLLHGSHGISDSCLNHSHSLVCNGYRTIDYIGRTLDCPIRRPKTDDVDTLADDFELLLRTLKLDGATVVAHACRCKELLRALANHGSLHLRSVVLVSPFDPHQSEISTECCRSTIEDATRIGLPVFLILGPECCEASVEISAFALRGALGGCQLAIVEGPSSELHQGFPDAVKRVLLEHLRSTRSGVAS